MSKLCAIANECTPKELDDKNKDKDSKVMNDDNWIQPKKFTPITCLFKTCKDKVVIEENNNECIMLIDDDDNDEEAEDEKKENKNSLKRKNSKKQRCESKAR